MHSRCTSHWMCQSYRALMSFFIQSANIEQTTECSVICFQSCVTSFWNVMEGYGNLANHTDKVRAKMYASWQCPMMKGHVVICHDDGYKALFMIRCFIYIYIYILHFTFIQILGCSSGLYCFFPFWFLYFKQIVCLGFWPSSCLSSCLIIVWVTLCLSYDANNPKWLFTRSYSTYFTNSDKVI